ERTLHRDEAVEHYNAYLVANPRAEDRFEIADTIRELGGQPVTMPTLIDPVFETAPHDGEDSQQGEAEPLDDGSLDAGDPPATEDEPPQDPEPPPAPPKPPTHGRFLAAIQAGASPNLSRASAIDAPAIVSLELQGGGFVGPRRRLLIGAQTTVSSGAALRADGFAFFAYSLGLLLEQTFVLGRERDAVLLGVGAVAALTGQSLSQRTDVPPPICTIARGAQIAGRSGFMIAPRGEFEVLLGPRRRSMLGVQLQPSFAVFGDGPRGDQCSDGTTPWTNLGVRRRWQFQIQLGLNYGFRF
ncbi:MAG: hypothetical protein KC431_01555, partial [Myxococcales bacterium]|nr:hypothetical protein [Myxococcales bacterium]